MTLKAQVLPTGLPGPWPLSGLRLAPPAALWLWNQIGAVTSTYSDQCDLCSSPGGVLSEPGIDTPGAEKVFFCREQLGEYLLINSAPPKVTHWWLAGLCAPSG